MTSVLLSLFFYSQLSFFIRVIDTLLPTMQIVLSAVIFLALVASARDFVLYDDANYGGAAHIEACNNDAACCMSCLSLDMEILIIKDIIGNLNGKGDRASSLGGDAGCTIFFR